MKVRITANQVTFTRLALMPVLGVLLYGGPAARTVAMILGTFVGATDFLDGYLARKYGVTVLGALMDPIADKVFVAVALLPLVDVGWAPWWLAYAILLREFVVTALRSSFELRKRSLRSTYLAKIKTWVQMLVLLLIVAVHVLGHQTLVIFFSAVPAAALLLGLIWLVRGQRWQGIWIFFGAWAVNAGAFVLLGTEAFIAFWGLAMVAITWVSAADYVWMALRDLKNSNWGDFTRISGAVLVPMLCVLCLHRLPGVMTAALILIVAVECAHGGLDNLLAHHEETAPAWAWAVRMFTTALLLGAALLVFDTGAAAAILILGALTVTLAGTGAEFWRKRRYYLDDKPPVKRAVAAPVTVRPPA